MRRWLAVLPLVGLALLAALVGKPVPALTVPSLETGQAMAIHDAARGPVLVNFYASWCAPCEIEAPALMRLKAQGVTIIGVAYKDAPDNSRAFLLRLGDPFAARLLDRDGRAGLEFGVTSVPESFLVDAGATITAKFTGELQPDEELAIIAATRR